MTHSTAGTVATRPRSHSQQLLQDVLSLLRTHLGMDVAFVSRIREGRRIFEYVDADPTFAPVHVGDWDSLDDTYCARVLDGRVPALVMDAGRVPELADLPVTEDLGIGSHLSVPVRSDDGELYGTLCCFSRHVDPSLGERDLDLLQVLSQIVGRHVDPLVSLSHEVERTRDRITAVLDDGRLRMALQPIVDLGTGRVTDYEALARFDDPTGWAPDRWFREAHAVGMGAVLESAAVHAAISLLPRLPDGVRLAVNVSAPALLWSASIPAMFAVPDAHRLVLELTEHADIADPRLLDTLIRRARESGVGVAIDDAGSGYAGLQRILSLHPEVVKLDRALVDRVARNPARQAMCHAMVDFARATGARLVAEGVETAEDADMLRSLGVGHAQGYFFGRPEVWD